MPSSLSPSPSPSLWRRALLTSGLLAGLLGCGEVSYFDVTVRVRTGVVQLNQLDEIDSCQVTVSGAASAMPFDLTNCAAQQVRSFEVGAFQYGTEAESGTVTFHVDLYNGNLRKLGEGEGSGAVKKGGRQPVTVEIMPDAAAFAQPTMP